MEVSFSTGSWNVPIEFMNVIGTASMSPFATKLSNFSSETCGDSIKKVFVELLVFPEEKKLSDRSKYISERQMWHISVALHSNMISESQTAANLYILDRVIEVLLKAGARLKKSDFSHKEFASELKSYINERISKAN
jgi:hypothetical protein